MDRTSVKVLKYIKKNGGLVSSEIILEEFGNDGAQSLKMLCDEGYLSRGLERIGSQETLCDVCRLLPHGYGFLQDRFWDLFDKWLNRTNALIPILGGALLSKPLWAMLEWVASKAVLVWEWICGWF